jgi:hypothetical protein
MNISKDALQYLKQHTITVTVQTDLFASHYEDVLLKLSHQDDSLWLLKFTEALPPVADMFAAYKTEGFRETYDLPEVHIFPYIECLIAAEIADVP